jgi:hypothetical protein
MGDAMPGTVEEIYRSVVEIVVCREVPDLERVGAFLEGYFSYSSASGKQGFFRSALLRNAFLGKTSIDQ